MARKSTKVDTGGFSAFSALLILLIAASAGATVAAAKSASGSLVWWQLIPYGIYMASIPLAWFWLRLAGFRGDNNFVAATLLLAGLGVVMQYRMASGPPPQSWPLTWLAYPLGFIAMLLTTTLFGKRRFEMLAKAGWLCYLASLAVLALMIVMGRSYRGGTYMAGNINPSEIVKPLLVVAIAAFLALRQKFFSAARVGIPLPNLAHLLVLLALWALPMGMVLYLKDLGLLILMNALLVVMLYIATRRSGYLVFGTAGVVALAMAAMMFSPHARTRLEIWQNPFSDPTGKGWQVLQGLTAMYNGGLWGAGFGAGAPHSVPIAASDFVYAVWAEEMGLVGCLLLLTLFAAFFLRGWLTSRSAATPFAVLAGTGVVVALAMQTILNVAGVTKAMPLTGIPLPFISHGGSSLVATMVMAGIVAALSDRGKRSAR